MGGHSNDGFLAKVSLKERASLTPMRQRSPFDQQTSLQMSGFKNDGKRRNSTIVGGTQDVEVEAIEPGELFPELKTGNTTIKRNIFEGDL